MNFLSQHKRLPPHDAVEAAEAPALGAKRSKSTRSLKPLLLKNVQER